MVVQRKVKTNNMASEINAEISNHKDNNSNNGTHNVNNNNGIPPDAPSIDPQNGVSPVVPPNGISSNVDPMNKHNSVISPRSTRRSREKTPDDDEDGEINLAQIFLYVKGATGGYNSVAKEK